MMNVLKKEYGIDYEQGLKNCMGDLPFYQKILSIFLKDDCFARAKVAYASKDYSALFDIMHEMKGVSGNAALTELYSATLPLVELLRHGTADDKAVEELFVRAETAYDRAYMGAQVIVERG